MLAKISVAVLLLCLAIGPTSSHAQPRVDARNLYERVLAIVPLTGSGTSSDPKRPKFAPTPADMQQAMTTRTGILGFAQVISDDGNFALVEFVARDRAAFQQILSDPTIKAFLKGRDRREDVEAEFLKYKKGFDFSKFGVRMR